MCLLAINSVWVSRPSLTPVRIITGLSNHVSPYISFFALIRLNWTLYQLWHISSVQFSRSVVSDSFQSHGLQQARPPCPSPTPRVYSNLCPLGWWCHLTISSSVFPFSCLLSFPESGSFLMSQLFTSGIGASISASVLLMNIQGWFPLGMTGWISMQSKGLSKIFTNSTVQQHQFFGTQPSLWSNSHIPTWLLEKP